MAESTEDLPLPNSKLLSLLDGVSTHILKLVCPKESYGEVGKQDSQEAVSGWQCRKTLRSLLPADTSNLQLHIQQLSLKRT